MKRSAGEHASAAARRLRLDTVKDYLLLGKPKVMGLSLASTAAGYLVSATAGVDPLCLAATLSGTVLLAAASGVFNQYIERGADGRMLRTVERPLPSSRMSPAAALVFGVVLGAFGVTLLAVFVNLLTLTLGVLTMVSYLFLYTPLKRVSPLSTWVGGLSGAIPPMMGCAAASGALSPAAWSLFLVLYLWQIPHSLSIAWMHREDYRRAGFRPLTVTDPSGRRAGFQAALHCALLLAASLLPFAAGACGRIYLASAVALGLAFAGFGAAFALRVSDSRARLLLRTSVIYLPLLLLGMAVDRFVRI